MLCTLKINTRKVNLDFLSDEKNSSLFKSKILNGLKENKIKTFFAFIHGLQITGST